MAPPAYPSGFSPHLWHCGILRTAALVLCAAALAPEQVSARDARAALRQERRALASERSSDDDDHDHDHDHDREGLGLALHQVADLSIFQTKGTEVYRIPALLVLTGGSGGDSRAGGAVLAFAEQRLNTGDGNPDSGDINVVASRSEDGGRTWSPAVAVCDDGEDVCGNPAPVEDARGRVHLLVSRNPAGSGELSGHVRRSVWVVSSEDQGLTWLPPRDITASAKRDAWKWYATGPGHGIRLQHQRASAAAAAAYPGGPPNGRLLIPCDHSEVVQGGKTLYASHVVFSDDHGETWQIGQNIPEDSEDGSNEASLAELGDGSLVMSARNYVGKPMSNRLYTTSADGGVNWAREVEQAALQVPDCEGSVVAVGGGLPAAASLAQALHGSNASLAAGAAGSDVLLFSHSTRVKRRWEPNGPWDRHDLRLSASTDGGRSWPASATALLQEGLSGYSDIQVLHDGKLLVLFETGNNGVRLKTLAAAAV